MISFKEFLAEARMAPLYHATNYKNLDTILSGGLQPRTFHDNRKLLKQSPKTDWSRVTLSKGISSTRDFETAKQMGSLIIVLDQNKIDQRYQIKPIQFFTDIENGKRYGSSKYTGGAKSSKNEFEEFIITDKPLDKKYFKAIFISKSAILPTWYIPMIEEEGLPYDYFTR